MDKVQTQKIKSPNHVPSWGREVSIAIGYGQDDLGIEFRWGRAFTHLSRRALGTTQPPVQWVPGVSRGKERPGRDPDPITPSSVVVMKG